MNEVTLERDGRVAVITLNAPGRRNALTPAMAAELSEACNAADGNPGVGAVVVRGAGGCFCAGAELETLSVIAQDPAEDGRFAALGSIYSAFARVGELGVPTIAAVRGAAVGAGLNLALSTDLRIASPDAHLTAGFLAIGVHPGGGSLTLLERLVGREAAAALALFGESLTGERAHELGAVWETVADDQVEARALALASRAAADIALARRTVATWRTESATRLALPVAVEYERAAQMWSLRRRGTA